MVLEIKFDQYNEKDIEITRNFLDVILRKGYGTTISNGLIKVDTNTIPGEDSELDVYKVYQSGFTEHGGTYYYVLANDEEEAKLIVDCHTSDDIKPDVDKYLGTRCVGLLGDYDKLYVDYNMYCKNRDTLFRDFDSTNTMVRSIMGVGQCLEVYKDFVLKYMRDNKKPQLLATRHEGCTYTVIRKSIFGVASL